MKEFIDIIPNVIKIIRDMLGLRSQSAFRQTCRYLNEHSTDYKLLVHAHFFPTEMAYQKKIFWRKQVLAASSMKHSEEEKKETHPLSTITPAMNSMIIHYKALFFIARAHAYKDLPSRWIVLLELVKAGSLDEIQNANITMDELETVIDNQHMTLTSWASFNNRRWVLDYFYQVIITPFYYIDNSPQKIDVHKRNNQSYRILHFAAWCLQPPAILESLLKDGADINCRTEFGYNALIFAAMNGGLKVVECLLKNKASIDATTDINNTALTQSAIFGPLDVIKLLIESKADINKEGANGGTALFFASEMGHLPVVRYLIESKATISTRTSNHDATPLFIAAERGYLEIINELVGRDKEIIHVAARDGFTPLMIAAGANDLDIVKYLIENKADINTQMHPEGRTALMIATYQGNFELVKYLVEEKKADTHLATSNNSTALMFAAYRGYFNIVELFVTNDKSGINVATSDQGSTALMFAAQEGHLRIVIYLVENGANIHVTKKLGSTALMLTSNLAIIQYLVGKGADINASKKDGTTKLMCAVANGQTDIIKYIVSQPNVLFQYVKTKNKKIIPDDAIAIIRSDIYKWHQDAKHTDPSNPLFFLVDYFNSSNFLVFSWERFGQRPLVSDVEILYVNMLIITDLNSLSHDAQLLEKIQLILSHIDSNKHKSKVNPQFLLALRKTENRLTSPLPTPVTTEYKPPTTSSSSWWRLGSVFAYYSNDSTRPELSPPTQHSKRKNDSV